MFPPFVVSLLKPYHKLFVQIFTGRCALFTFHIAI